MNWWRVSYRGKRGGWIVIALGANDDDIVTSAPPIARWAVNGRNKIEYVLEWFEAKHHAHIEPLTISEDFEDELRRADPLRSLVESWRAER